MQNQNLSTLEVECKETLHELLRPQLYRAIDPWMRSASPREKRSLVNLGSILKEKPVTARTPAVVNYFGKITPLNHTHQTLDRTQSDLFRKTCNSDEVNEPLRKRKQHFVAYREVEPSGGTVLNYFSLNKNRLNSQSYAHLLNTAAQDRLTNWQECADHKKQQERAMVVDSLRTIEKAVHTTPKYNLFQAQKERQNSRRRGATLYDFWKTDRAASEQGLTRSISMPGIPGGEMTDSVDPEIANITKPGGYRVKMTDTTTVQYMKNKQKAMTCKVVMMGGSGGWKTTYQNCFPKYDS